MLTVKDDRKIANFKSGDIAETCRTEIITNRIDATKNIKPN